MRILILEDDTALCRGICLALKSPEREIVLCHSITQAKESIQSFTPDLFLLDINLPDGSGLDFCATLRVAGYVTPILMLTVNDTELDMVNGLENGADDYMTKPFSLALLRARVEALLRRGAYGQIAATDRIMNMDGFVFDFETLRFEKNGQPVELSKTEARLLQVLFTNKGQTMPRERLLGLIWPDGSSYVDENALSVAVRRLRAKLEDVPSQPRYIKTIHGIGYQWAVSL
ncbi:DNA-binding response regulator [Clostridia bacterium]|nr:DNA-binding response regulator [Clostridia bacterium]